MREYNKKRSEEQKIYKKQHREELKRKKEEERESAKKQKQEEPEFIATSPEPFDLGDFVFDEFDIISLASDPKNVNDAYALFGLQSGASWDDITKKYQSLIRLVHPDVNLNRQQQANENTQKINAAYDILKSKRDAYQFFGLDISASLQEVHHKAIRMAHDIKEDAQKKVEQIKRDTQTNINRLETMYQNLERNYK
jgi:hypothetical protein